MANIPQRSFASGELCPALYARTDVAKYATGLRTCRNFIIQATGGANMRPGLDYCGAVKDSTVTERLIKFVFNNLQAYVLEFGNRYIRVYQNGARVAGVEITTPYLTAELAAINYVQSGDVMTLVHPNHPVAQLSRTSSTVWTYAVVSFAPQIATPSSLHVVPGVLGPGRVNHYFVTAIDAITGEESYAAGGDAASGHTPTAAQPDALTWAAVTGASEYRVYQTIDDPPSLVVLPGDSLGAGFIGSVTDPAFSNPGYTPDYTRTPPQPFTDLQSAGNYPSVVGFYQQRQLYANTTNEPDKVWCSRTGLWKNFTVSAVLQDDDPVIFSLANAEMTQVQHLLDLGKLVIGTEGGEWLIEGDANGVLTPTAINARVGSYNGCAALQPVKVGNSVLYVQALGNKVLELKTNIYQGYYVFTGKDVTVFSKHLFDGYTITDWDYAQIPNYITWVVRSDGTLLGFTYLDDQQLSAWYRCDTLGSFEQVCCIPEGGEHRLYVVVARDINGTTQRSIERLRPLTLGTIADASYLDSALEYDGRAVGSLTNTLTLTGSGWTPGDLLTMTASSATEFSSARVGDARFLRNAAGTQVVATITAIIDATHATVDVDIDVPSDMQAVAITDWDRAVMFADGLSHLEGQNVAVFADNLVVASPNNPTVTVITVSGGEITLDQAYAHIRAGLPYLPDLETLDIDTPQGPSLKESNIEVTRVGLWVQASRGVWMGRTAPTGTDATAKLRELKIRSSNITPADPNPLVTDYVKQDIVGEWNSNGRVFIRQIDPVPLNVLAVIPLGYLPEGN